MGLGFRFRDYRVLLGLGFRDYRVILGVAFKVGLL